MSEEPRKYPVPNLCEGPPAPKLLGRIPIVWAHDLGTPPMGTPIFGNPFEKDKEPEK